MLQKQSIPINFQGGMNTKTDTKQLDLGNMYKIVNGVYTSPKKVDKRGGYNALSKYTTDGVEVEDLASLAIFNAELVGFSDTSLYSYSDNISKWVDRGNISNLKVSSIPVMRNAYGVSSTQSASINNIGAFSWVDSRGGCRFSIVDLDSNTFFQSDISLTSTGSNPKIVINQNQFYLFYREVGVLKYRKVNSAAPTSIGTAVSLKTNLNTTNPTYVLKNVNDRIYLAYHSTEASPLQILYLNSSDATSSVVEINDTATSCMEITNDSSDRIWITYHNGTSVFALCLSYTLTATLLTVTTIETLGSVVNISLIETAANTMTILYTVLDAAPSKYLIKKNTITLAGVVGTATVFLRSVSQASRLFANNGVQYSLVVHDSSLQPTYFLVNLAGIVQARFSPGVGGVVPPQDSLSEVYNVVNDKYLLPSQIKSIVEGPSSTSISTTYGMNRSIIDFVPTINYQDSTIGENLYVTGGVLKNYDGAVVVEDNFFLFPEGLVAGANAASGGSMSNGTYQYIAIYSWFDNRGQLHRSETSIPLSKTTSAGGTSQTQIITIPTLRLTQKANVFVELYRTETLGSIFYSVTSLTSPVFNDTTLDVISITDTLSDASLISREQLYTTGGILDNSAAPNASIIANWKNRLVLAGLEDDQQIAYSKIFSPGSPAQFSDALKVNISNQGGPVTALGVLDDKLILFKESLMFALAGNGPNNAGEQSDFTQPELISSDVGCSDPSSVVVVPDGIMFKSSKGIYLLDRGMNVSYIGAEVEEYNASQVTSATLVPNNNQVRFLTDDNYCLVYDTFFKKWSVFDNHGGKDAEVLNGSYMYLRSNENLVYKQDSSYLDNGQSISLQIDMGWLSFAGIQGFQRVYKLLALGEYFSPHKLIIDVAYNYQNLFIESKTVDSSDFINAETYGDGSPYGSDTYYGGDSGLNAYQFRLNMRTQKAQSIRIRIREVQNDVTGRGLSLSNLNFEVGLKAGTGKIKQSQTFGTT